MFNDAISFVGLNEIELIGRKFTWSNQQHPSPLLEKLDWVFSNAAWTVSFPSTSVKALGMEPSHHCPCLISISTSIPRRSPFRFENFWLKNEQFLPLIQHGWSTPVIQSDKAKILTAKFKKLRQVLRDWQASQINLGTIIQNVKRIIQLLEVMRDYRDLSLQEWNFLGLLNDRLNELLLLQKTYYKQRGAIKWAKLGDAGTYFFHANASLRNRKKLITQLTLSDGSIVSNHKDKELAIWEEYKIRLGISEFEGFSVDFTAFVNRLDNLDSLEDPFSNVEVDDVIKNLPNNKSPGPDGFNNEFYKKCWNIIKTDFYNLCSAFHGGNICLKSLNSSLITLIPKNDSPSDINDYRPISLLNSFVKLLTKILANRLQPVITKLIHKNQYGFIQSRTIQDCLAWAFEYLHLCHHSKKQIVIIKIDFEKAFDKIEHQAILNILKAKGFGSRWLSWIEAILTSATSAVLLNRMPGKKFNCKRGVRQGDPLSPLLFVLAADFLQSMINNAKDMGQLNLPIQMQHNKDFPVIQYADDTLIIAEGDPKQLFFLRSVMNTFSLNTGLKVNFMKTMMVPINVPEERL